MTNLTARVSTFILICLMRVERLELSTVFNLDCEKFYSMIQDGKTYYISNMKVKSVNQKYVKDNQNCEITFNEETEVTECNTEAATSVPTNIVIGGTHTHAENKIQFTSKAGKPLKKRKITLVDPSTVQVDVILWSNEADNYDGSSQPDVLVTDARLEENASRKKLCLKPRPNCLIDPDVRLKHELREWFNNGGANTEVTYISAKSGGSGGGNNDWLTFAEAEARQLGSTKEDFYSHLGVLALPIADNAVYKACPQERCNKKLENRENGGYFCEKCDKEYKNYKYRILLKATVFDPTGDREITAFNEAAEAMLGASATEVGRLSDYDNIAYIRLFEDAKFKTFVFKYSVKTNDKARLNITVLSATPVDIFNGNA